MKNIPIDLKNGYILIQDIKDTTLKSGLYVPDEKYNRFARVLAVGENSIFNVGDVILKPIGRSTPIKLDGEIYETIREGFIFAKVVE